MYYTFVEATKFTQRVTKLKLENNYAKDEQDKLTPQQKKQLREVVRRLFEEP